MNAPFDPPRPLSAADSVTGPTADWPRFEVKFRMVDLVALLVGAFLLLMLLGSIGHTSREPSRRIQCTNNLKQIGLGLHNFHDTFNGVPPLALGDARESFFVHIMPFAEANNVYKLYQPGQVLTNTDLEQTLRTNDGLFPHPTWTALNAAERDAAGRVRWMHCPARRSGIQQRDTSDPNDLYAGPLGDYAVVFLDQDPVPDPAKPSETIIPAPDVSAATGWHRHQDPCDDAQVQRQKGLIRLALIDCDLPLAQRYRAWRPRDTFARATDGTANTFVVGEKHLRKGELGQYSASQDDQDGVYLFTSATGGRSYNVARNLGLPLGQGPNDKRFTRGKKPFRGPHADFGFGSWHSSAVTQFLRADGSVATITLNTDAQLLRRLAHVSDGLPVEGSGY